MKDSVKVIELMNYDVLYLCDLRRVQLQRAVDAGRHAGQDDPGVSFKTLRPSVDERDDGAGIQDAVFVTQEGDLKGCSIKFITHHKVIKDKTLR